jgi:nucleoside-diphosphate-sugar epimerase
VNLGSGTATTIKNLATTLMRIYEMENKFIFTKARENDVYKLQADITFAKACGYDPKVSLEEGLRKYIGWWRKNV